MSIIQFGCGGTGSYLGRPLIKFLSNLKNRYGDQFNCKYTVVDGDTVSARNILRQNFTEDHISLNKAKVLKFENDYFYKDCIQDVPYMITTTKQMKNFYDGFFKQIQFRRPIPNNNKCIVLGCVDNNKSRRLIFKYIKDNSDKQIVYLDSGNNLHNGQIITTIFNEHLKQILYGVDFENINFLKYFPLKVKEANEESCAFFGDQSQSINMFASTLLFMNIQKLIIEGRLPPNKIEFNNSGYSTFDI